MDPCDLPPRNLRHGYEILYIYLSIIMMSSCLDMVYCGFRKLLRNSERVDRRNLILGFSAGISPSGCRTSQGPLNMTCRIEWHLKL
ncbi:hypothetical protein K503DRAFT_418721 [Rhizopogon vinicolor AM-OR11-026]|uniref:Uncharacterized protein n=1 Tax=Rhizopogon vinicolor AM-OR11-026 TaxID=1314800 RepID=A0A1B7MQC1_9AGAM|nr:hypothetical protein K503DRAFT_418721 [Rhizopogon vinicolor AM-OR11-026]